MQSYFNPPNKICKIKNEGDILENDVMYRKIISNLIYLAIVNCYLSFVVGLVS